MASSDPARLRDWYQRAFRVTPDPDGFLSFGPVRVLIDGRDNVANRAAEPTRTILNFHVDDAAAMCAHLETLPVTWVAKLENRNVAWFAALEDADGNVIQIIELTPAYFAERATRTGTLEAARVATRLPVQNLDRARRFYAERLGLEPAEERPGGLRYECMYGSFSLFESVGRPSGAHTQMAWEVDDIDAVVAELQGRGVVFEEYDTPGMKTAHGIAEIRGHYPSRGGFGERGAWFHDSEGNLVGIGQAVRDDGARHER